MKPTDSIPPTSRTPYSHDDPEPATTRYTTPASSRRPDPESRPLVTKLGTVGARRLLKLADHLETVPRQRFNMSTWSCGTSACAMGHACEIPAFKRLGLEIGIMFGSPLPVLPSGKEGFGAAVELFGITHTDAYALFKEQFAGRPTPKNLAGKDTPKVVARRIRKFVREHTSG